VGKTNSLRGGGLKKSVAEEGGALAAGSSCGGNAKKEGERLHKEAGSLLLRKRRDYRNFVRLSL